MRRRAFTLIELIIVTAILIVVIVSIYSAFNIGIKAWRKGGEGQDIQKVRIGFLNLQKELKNSFFFSEIPFKGTSSEMSFPLVVPGQDKDDIHIVTYYISEDKDTKSLNLMRKETPFSENPEDKKEAIETRVFSANLIGFKYAYGLKDGSKGFEWRDFWPEAQKNLPSGVRISFKLDDGEEIYNKTIFIPQGALGAE